MSLNAIPDINGLNYMPNGMNTNSSYDTTTKPYPCDSCSFTGLGKSPKGHIYQKCGIGKWIGMAAGALTAIFHKPIWNFLKSPTNPTVSRAAGLFALLVPLGAFLGGFTDGVINTRKEKQMDKILG